MAKSKKTSSKSAKSTKKTVAKAAPRRRAAPKALASVEDVKRLAKAPGDYEEIVDKFTDALATTRFRAPISAGKMLSQKKKAKALGKKASALELKFTVADRARMVAESLAYKSLLSNWRSVQARFPDEPELEEAFQFMVEWMSVNRPPAEDGGGGGGGGGGGTP